MTLPWKISRDAGCPIMRPYGVVKETDDSLVACHATQAEAEAHMRALYANMPEADKHMQDNKP